MVTVNDRRHILTDLRSLFNTPYRIRQTAVFYQRCGAGRILDDAVSESGSEEVYRL